MWAKALRGSESRPDRTSSVRKAEAETMAYANSVSAVMAEYSANDVRLNDRLRKTVENQVEMDEYRRADEARTLEAVDWMPEDLLDDRLLDMEVLGTVRAMSRRLRAQEYNNAYDAKDVADEQLPGKVHRAVINMALSNAVRTGDMEGKGFRRKRKPTRPSLFDIVEMPDVKRRGKKKTASSKK